jgi:galactokinase
MTGGGFGGCIVALVQPRSVDLLRSHLNDVYSKKIGKPPTIFATAATAGAEVVG